MFLGDERASKRATSLRRRHSADGQRRDQDFVVDRTICAVDYALQRQRQNCFWILRRTNKSELYFLKKTPFHSSQGQNRENLFKKLIKSVYLMLRKLPGFLSETTEKRPAQNGSVREPPLANSIKSRSIV